MPWDGVFNGNRFAEEIRNVTLWVPIPCATCGEVYKRAADGRLLYTQQAPAEPWECAACSEATAALGVLGDEWAKPYDEEEGP